MELELFRVSLIETGNLFALSKNGTYVSREEWMRFFFSEERNFHHRKKSFVFVPEKNIANNDGSLLFGYIARKSKRRERSSPSRGLEPMVHEYWQAALIVIDPADHSDGQKVFIENLPSVGLPFSILLSLFGAMTAHQESAYTSNVFRIVRKGSFDAFAAMHRNSIKKMTFEVSTPNMFRDRNDFQDELKSLRDKEKVKRVKTTLESDTKIKHDTPRLKDVVDYTEKGAGKLTAVAEDGSKYDSDDHRATVSVDVPNHNEDKDGFVASVFKVLKDLL